LVAAVQSHHASQHPISLEIQATHVVADHDLILAHLVVYDHDDQANYYGLRELSSADLF
jgi:hypothetical protein